MTGRLRLTMLGTTNTGKTCFMLAMHAVGQSGRGLQGFTLRAKNRDENIKLTNEWRTLRTTTGVDRWPPNTTEANFVDHTFEFCYGFDPLAEFAWLDYRGSALAAFGADPDTKALVEDATASDGIILCVPGAFFTIPLHASEDDLEEVREKAEVDAMNHLLEDAVRTHRQRQNRPFPIIIAITKFDVCAEARRLSNGALDEPGILEDVQQLFRVPFMPGQNCQVLIAPVSLGDELAQSPETGRIRPRNMDLPIVFMYFAHLQAEIERHRHKVAQRKRDAQGLAHRGILQRLFGGDREDQDALNLVQLAESELKQPEETLRRLASILDGAHIYLNGAKQEELA